jgi:hypothetical protein
MTSLTPIRDYLEQAYKQNQRPVLDAQPHFVPLDINTLTLTLSNVLNLSAEDLPEDMRVMTGRVTSISAFKQQIVNYAKANFRGSILISGKRVLARNAAGQTAVNPPTDILVKQFTPAVVYKGTRSDDNIVGVLFSSFKATQENLFSSFINKSLTDYLQETVNVLIKNDQDQLEKTGGARERKKSERVFNIGHVFGSQANTPLQRKIERVLSILAPLAAAVGGETPTVNIDGQNFTVPTGNTGSQLTALKANVDAIYDNLKTQSTYGATIEASFSKTLKGFLSKVEANVVIVQDSYENQRIYADLLETPYWRKIKNLIPTANFSRSLVEEMAYAYANTILGKGISSGKSSVSLVPVKMSTKIKTSLTTGKSKLKVNIKTGSVQKTTKATSNLVQLQNLINASLIERVKANMGTGNRRDVLNLRTGRFAESVKIERMSESREGMITAFYSYMKNPYATFSQGGRQESPRSRDPKLLIAKSIREIAAQQVANRLRSVSV